MRTAEQRDDQTVTIFTAVLLFAAVVGGGMLLGILAELLGLGLSDGAGQLAYLVLTYVGVALAVWYLMRRRG